MPTAKKPLFPARHVALARGARALAHPARVAIVCLLLERGELACHEIVATLPLAQATVSQHLKVLRESGLVVGKACGKQVCYSIALNKVGDFLREFRTMLGQS